MIREFGKLAEQLGTVQSAREIGMVVGDFIESVLQINHVSLFLYDHKLGRLKIMWSKGFQPEELQLAEASAHERHPGMVFERNELSWNNDVSSPEGIPHVNTPRSFRVNSNLTIPVASDEKPLGVLTMASDQIGYFKEIHVDMMRSACNIVGIAYRNLLRMEEQQRLLRDLLEAKREAEQANEAKTLFLANVSHELRTPIHGIKGLLHLASSTEDNIKRGEYASYMSDSLVQLETVVSDLLDISMLQTGRFLVRNEWFRLDDFLPGILAEFRAQAEEKGLALRDHIDHPSGLEVWADKGRLRQVLSILIQNAIKYTPSGWVQLKAVLNSNGESSALFFQVKDSGIGIDDNDLRHIFDPFYRVNGSDAERAKGTGLGLAVCQQITQKMGGSVHVESELGQGTVFSLTFHFPTRSAIPNALPLVESDHNFRVLIAEDNEVNQLIMTNLMQDWEVDFALAENGNEAVSRAALFQPDIILMDLNMPEKNGFEALFAIREAGMNMPIIAFTANMDSKEEARCKAAGFAAYFSKPFEEEALKSLITGLLRQGTQV